MKKWLKALIILFCVAAFLRFWNLGQNPPSLTWDEAAWGYNAYSLGINGKDEFGRFLPHDYLESFGDFKPPVYAYLDVIPVKIFGLNEFAVRFPSALFGFLTVVVTYFLVKRIFYSIDSRSQKLIAFFSAFSLAISPWHINLSRAAFEANVATFFLVTGVWLLLRGVQEKKSSIVLSAASFVVSIYTFNSARIVAPLLVLFLALIFRKKLLERKREVLIALIVAIILVLPTAKFLLSSKASMRFNEVNIFSDISVIERTNQEIKNDNGAWWSKIIHNRRIAYSVEYLRHYFDNLNPSFLFIKGDGNPKFSTQDVGEMYLWELPFFIAGIIFLFKKKQGYWWIIPFWLLIGIIPAATARETPHALRIETTLPTFQILVGYGILSVLTYFRPKIQNGKRFKLILAFVFALLFLNFLYYYHGYYTHYPKQFSGEWQYGYRESINYVETIKNDYKKIYITSELGRPYIYYLFYAKVSPDFFQKTATIKRDPFGFVTVEKFDKYFFARNLGNLKRDILYVNVPSEVSGKARILKTFYLLNGRPSLVVYTI